MSVEARDWVLALRAAAGGPEALHDCLKDPEAGARLGLGPALALQAQTAGIDPPGPWRKALRASAANWLLLEEEARSLAQCLERASIEYVALKGLAVAHDYRSLLSNDSDASLARPTSDIDLLIRRVQRREARELLTAEGWHPLFQGPRAERYLDDEGYAWQAESSRGALLELHHDLWNSVPSRLADLALEEPFHQGGPLTRPQPALRFVVAAVHGVLEPRPRRALDLLDLEAIRRSAGTGLADEVIACCRATGLQLPVAAAATLAEKAFGHATYRELEGRLLSDCRWLERSLDASELDSFSGTRVSLLRLLSGRPTRLGVRSLWRRAWPHPGIVERDTPESLPWWRRRLRRQLRVLQLTERGA